MPDLNSVLKQAKTWEDIYQFLLGKLLAGKIFEQFTKFYFLCEPIVCQEYKNVWLFEEVPLKIRQKLEIGNKDYGIDLVLENQEGRLSVVQCKFKQDQTTTISRTKDKLTNLFADGDKADFFIFFTNASEIDKHTSSKKANKVRVFTYNDLLSLSADTLKAMSHLAGGKKIDHQEKKKPRDYQETAINTVVKELEGADRGQLILPCGTGKTLIPMWIHERINPKYTLVLFPSLALLCQTKNEWAANRKCYVPYMCVCSEKDIDKQDDNTRISIYELGGLVSTNSSDIRHFLHTHDQAIIFSTYQSLEAVAEAIRETDISFDLAICDEAHKTAGSKKGAYGLFHDNSALPIQKRLDMTATPRIIGENIKSRLKEEEVSYLAQMDDPEVFGHELYRMSFKEAIEQGILVDYQIIVMGVSDLEIQALIKERRFIDDQVTVDEIANNYALEKFMAKYQAIHALTFHSSVKKAEEFKERHIDLFDDTEIFHVNGKQSTSQRTSILHEFKNADKSVVTNARCLTEGIDIPAIDCVYFCDPKSSTVDIVQAAGRVLRRADHLGKKRGYIVVPIFHYRGEDIENAIQESSFKDLINVVRALSSHDERLTDEIRSLRQGKRPPSEKHLVIEGELNLITIENMGDLSQHLFSQIVHTIRLPWRPFEEAKAFVHSLNLKSIKEWKEYCRSGKKLDDIPAVPSNTYKNEGWVSWGDWLSTGIIASYNMIYKPFEEARAYVHSLNLKSGKEWEQYCKSGKKPGDIPAAPSNTYKNEGWVSWGDWLGKK